MRLVPHLTYEKWRGGTFRDSRYRPVFVGITALLIVIAVYPAVDGGMIQFDTAVVELGSLRQGQQAAATFRFRNHGPFTAAILDVAPACGLTASLIRGRRTLARGEDGEVEVAIDTSRQGVLGGRLAVTLADPLERTIVLSVKAVVEPEFLVESSILDFGNVAPEASVQREFRIRLNNTQHRVLSAHSTDETFDVYVAHQTDEVARLVVKAKTQTQLGRKFGTVRVATSSPHMPQLIVPVRAVVTNAS